MRGYDGLLAAMPASVAGGALLGWAAAIPLGLGLVVGCLVATVFLLVSLFVVPPGG